MVERCKKSRDEMITEKSWDGFHARVRFYAPELNVAISALAPPLGR